MQKPLNRDAIKLAAMATMACNHFAQALLPAARCCTPCWWTSAILPRR